MERYKSGLFDRRIIRWLATDGGIALMLALAISTVLLGMQRPITEAHDYQLLHHFCEIYLRASIHAGELPLWNPYAALGYPFLADPQTAVFYPPTWIFILLPEVLALFLFLVFHFWLASFFFLKLARQWAAPREASIGLAFAYLLSGPFLGRLLAGQLGYFCGLAYWPLLFYLAERLRKHGSLRTWLALVLAASGSFLCGHPQCFWFTAVAVGCYLVGVHLGSPWWENGRRGLWCLGALVGAYAFALLLCAGQLLPTIDLMLEGNRPEPSLQFSAMGAVDYGDLTGLYIAQPFISQLFIWWEGNLYIGMICTAVGLLGLSQWRDARVRGLCLMGVFGFVLAMGQHTPLFAAMFRILPGISSFRIAARYAVFLPWAVLLAGLLAWTKGDFSRLKAMFVLCILLAGAVYVVWQSEVYWEIGLIDGALLGLAAFTVGWLEPRAGAQFKAAAGRVLLVLICADSLIATSRAWVRYNHMPRFPEAQIADMLHAKNLYPANGVPPRLFIPDSLVRANSGVQYGFSNVACFGSLTSMRVWTYLHLGAGAPLQFYQVTTLANEVYQAGPFPFPGMNIVLGGRYGSHKLSLNAQPGERAYLVHAWKQVPDWKSALQQMVQNHSDPTAVALLEAPAEGPSPTVADPSRDKAVIDAFHRNSIELHVRTSAPALLVVAEAWYPGWRATVNDVPSEVLPANVWMRAVRVPAGESRVELRYVEPSLARGAVISLCALLLLLVIGWRGWTRERGSSLQSPIIKSNQ